MTEIHVLFPESGPPIATQNQQAILGGRLIAWHIQSANEDVKQVRIRFDKPDAGYFPQADSKSQTVTLKSEYEKKLDYATVDAATRDRMRFTGSTLIWGTAPLPPGGESRRDDKYTIIGLDEFGDPIEELELDPYIIVDKP